MHRIKKLLAVAALSIGTMVLTSCGGAENMRRFAETDIRAAINERITQNIQLAEKLQASGFISMSTLNGTKQNLELMRKKYNEGDFEIQVGSDGKMTKAGYAESISYWRVLGGMGTFDEENEKILTYSTPDYVLKDENESGNADGTYESPVLFPTTVTEFGDTGSISPSEWVDNSGTKLCTYVLSNYLVGPGAWNLNHEVYAQPWVDNGGASGDNFVRVSDKVIQGKGINEWYGWANQTAAGNNEHGVHPLTLIDDSMAAEVNEKFEFSVYVLSPEMVDGMSIDGLVELLSKDIVKDANGNVINIGRLGNYFIPLRDANGKSVKLLDLAGEDLIIRESRQNPLVLGGTDPNKPGYDMVISQFGSNASDSSTGFPILTMRLSEFNSDGIDELDRVVGIHQDKFVFYRGDSTDSNNKDNVVNAVFLMEYPVYVIDSFTDNDTSGKGVEASFTQSGLGVNVMTGDMIKYDSDGNGGWTKAGKTITQDAKDLYLTTRGALNENDTGKASFIVQGKGTVNIPRSVFGKADDIESITGRIILRDYLEATYAPEYESDGDEDLTVFGRKIRIKFNDWEERSMNLAGQTVTNYIPIFDKDADMAFFVDVDGNEIVDSPKLKVTDFCNVANLTNKSKENRYVARFNYPGESEGEIPAKYTFKEKENMDISELKVKTLNKISPVVMFPSSIIGETDWATDTEQKQRFYCIATTKGMFDSALFSSWVDSTSKTASLTWWNDYLADCGFNYTISHEDLLTWLTGNYAYQLSQNGVVILDIETVAKIQDMYDDEMNYEKVQFIRTVFVVVGWFFVCISMLLMLLWVIDTNTDMGFSLIEKVTFGNWISVKYDSDIPSHNTNGQTYLTGGKMFIRSLILVAVGIVLMKVNAFLVVEMLIEMFGNLAASIEKVIKGMYY